MSMRSLIFGLALTTALTGTVFAQSSDATTTHTSSFAFPLVGLASTETLGVNLINLASNVTTTSSSSTSTTTDASCTGSVTFINAAGTTIGTANTYTLPANAVTSISLPFSSAGLTGNRGLVRTVVSTTTTNGVPCSLSFSLNTYDTSSGVTHVFLTGSGVTQPANNPGH